MVTICRKHANEALYCGKCAKDIRQNERNAFENILNSSRTFAQAIDEFALYCKNNKLH